MLVKWSVFQANGFRAEAQSFLHEQGLNKSVILFCPGFPGMGATLFEQRHAAALVAQGYDVTVIKHKGIRLDGPSAPVMVNNAERLWNARKSAETHIGGGPATIDEWLTEPVPALVTLAGQYDACHVIGNSFGALSALWSLTSGNVPLNKIRSLLLYAGAQGMPDSIMRIWKPKYIAMPRITDKVTLNDPKEVAATLGDVYKKLPERVKAGLPEHIPLTYLVVAKDEILKPADTEAFRRAIGGRGGVVVDDIDHAWPDLGLLAHDTPNYKTEDLLNLIKG